MAGIPSSVGGLTTAPHHGDSNQTTSHQADHILQKHFEFGLLEYEDPRFNFILFQLVCPILYCLITLVGIAGNTLVIYVILSRHNMRTTTNLLLLNLAMADIAFVLICPPFTAYQQALERWPFGDVLCKLMHYLINVTAYVTIYTLVLISVIRFLTVVCNKSSVAAGCTNANAVLMMAGIWGVMLLANIPILLAYGAQYNYLSQRHECEHYNLSVAKAIFTVFFVLAYLLPLSMIGVLSFRIMRHIQGNQSSLVSQHYERNQRRKKANRLLVTVVVVFALCWLPIQVHIMWAYYGDIPRGKTYTAFSLFFNPIAYANSCINPFIYNYFSKDFRDSFYQVICFCRKRRAAEDQQQEMVSLRNTKTTRSDKTKASANRMGAANRKGVTEVTDLEVKALIPQENERTGNVRDIHAAGAVYIGEMKPKESC